MSVNVVSKEMSRGKVKYMAQIAVLSAIAVILMLFEIPLPFAPSFYEIDFSEVPVLIGAFAMGPVAGVLIELIKVVLNLLINGTMTAGVGELANFLVGCAFVVPAALIYKKVRSRKGALIGMVTGTACLVLVGCVLNAFVLLPAYAAAFNAPIEGLIAAGTEVNKYITNLWTFVWFAVAPFNLVKGVAVSAIVMLVYKRISPLLKV